MWHQNRSKIVLKTLEVLKNGFYVKIKNKCTLNARGVENSFLPCKKSNATQQENWFFILTPEKCPDLKTSWLDFWENSSFHCRGVAKTRFSVLKTLEVLKKRFFMWFSQAGSNTKVRRTRTRVAKTDLTTPLLREADFVCLGKQKSTKAATRKPA